MIKLERSVCNDFKAASSREWLETNGIGGFAMGTVAGAGTRRYHSLLTAAMRPPLGRVRTVAKFEEKLIINDTEYELSSNQYPGSVYPTGFELISEFRLDPFPIWRYEVDGVVIERKLFMVYGSNSTVCRWSVAAGKASVKLEVRPLIAFTDYHHLQHENSALDVSYDESSDSVSIRPYQDQPGIFISHNAASVVKGGDWYRNFEYAIERERGFEYQED